jgi:hypothetical protein
MNFRNLFAVAFASGFLFNAGCSSSDDDKTPTGAVGGPVTGAADSHCTGSTPVEVVPDACTEPAEEEAEGGAPGAPADCNETHDDDYGETQFNSEGNDDDCKYHASWTSTPISLNQDVTVTVTTSNLTTDQPLEALADGKLPLSRVEVYQPCDPTRRGPTQNAKAEFTETAPGVYTGGPLRFDQKGRWVVRFHFYEQCFDGEGSPHGHVAFFVDVP